LRAYADAGVEVIAVAPGEDGLLGLDGVLRALGERGVMRLLVEGGGRLAAGLLMAGLVDRMACFRAPVVIGGDGVPAAAGFGLERLDDAPGFELVSSESLGSDRLETYRRRA
jgi:diaminohydroxyphosphoribosylaminopyrimidine deaminase/5-amino-6-(5-phosphoribosylamino)uracil reductase